MRFCSKTKGLTKEQNEEYAKDLKEFAQKEAEKFRNQSKEHESE